MSPDSAGAGKSKALGVWSLVCGVFAIVGVAMIAQASFGAAESFDPPGWLRILTGWMLPIGAIAAVILGIMSVKRDSGRNFGLAGITLAVIMVGIFVAMLVMNPY